MKQSIKLTFLVKAVVTTAALMAGQAWALPSWSFSYTGVLQTWVAPIDATYRVTAYGAQGGHGSPGPFVGGRGAEISGSFTFSGGSLFSLAVGGAGSSLPDQNNGGGGGGSFFVNALGTPLLIAGGGGGIRSLAEQDGFDASITAFGVASTGASPAGPRIIKTTDLGLGGRAVVGSWGSGGAGFFGDGQNDDPYGKGGLSWANLLLGGLGDYTTYCSSTGGFGGGGSGSGCGGGGGGGGYSGGDGGWVAGGGGSWNTGFDPFALTGVGFGDGRILIAQLTDTSIPEPGTLLLLGGCLVALAGSQKKNRRI